MQNTKYTTTLQFRRWRTSEHLCVAAGCGRSLTGEGPLLGPSRRSGDRHRTGRRCNTKVATGSSEAFFQKCSKLLCLMFALIVEKQALTGEREEQCDYGRGTLPTTACIHNDTQGWHGGEFATETCLHDQSAPTCPQPAGSC